jgi:hypothetical protein
MKMNVEMVILAFPGKRAESYDTKDEGINEIVVENDKVKIDFDDQGRNWVREIPISKLKFLEYPTRQSRKSSRINEENIYKGQEGGEIS